jgi:hypothetical protein
MRFFFVRRLTLVVGPGENGAQNQAGAHDLGASPGLRGCSHVG